MPVKILPRAAFHRQRALPCGRRSHRGWELLKLCFAEIKKRQARHEHHKEMCHKAPQILFEAHPELLDKDGCYEDPLFDVRIVRKPAIVITDEALLEDRFVRISIKCEPNKAAIVEALNNGEVVEGARFIHHAVSSFVSTAGWPPRPISGPPGIFAIRCTPW